LASSYIRHVLEWARRSQVSIAVLFTDIGAAFYSCLTEEAVGLILASPRRAEALAKLGFSDAEAAAFVERIATSPSGLAQGGLAPGWVSLLADWHRFSWFTTRLDGVRVMTVFGARPGDPLADLIFGVCYAVVQLEIRGALAVADLLPQILVPAGAVFPADGPVVPVQLGPVHYVDDTAVPVVATVATDILERLACVARIYRSICRRHGLGMNFAAGKSEAIVVLAGRGAIAASSLLGALPVSDGGDMQLPVPVLDCGDGIMLRIVPSYKHLGGMISGSASMNVEVTFRCAAARIACGALQRSCLGKQAIDEEARVMTAVACIHTRLGYLAGTWPDLPDVQLARWCSEFCRPLRAILGLHRPPPPGYEEEATSNAAVCRHLRVPIPEMVLAAARVQFAIRVAARESSYVTDILRSDGGQRWRDAVVRSCGVIRKLVPAKVSSLPDPAVDILAWECSWRSSPGMWKLLVKAAVRVASVCPWKTADTLRSADLNVQSVVLEEGPTDEFLCDLCSRWWPSRCSLAQHRRKAHGDVGLAESARSVAVGSVCPACGK
jgi:hypothetical protein